jgi:hypothetical protein
MHGFDVWPAEAACHSHGVCAVCWSAAASSRQASCAYRCQPGPLGAPTGVPETLRLDLTCRRLPRGIGGASIAANRNAARHGQRCLARREDRLPSLSVCGRARDVVHVGTSERTLVFGQRERPLGGAALEVAGNQLNSTLRQSLRNASRSARACGRHKCVGVVQSQVRRRVFK